MEQKVRKPNWSPKELLSQAAKLLKPMVAAMEHMSFWGVAFLCLLLRIFMVRPVGAVCALVVGGLWAYRNISPLKCFFAKLFDQLARLVGGYDKTSLWFEHGGRDTIETLVALLSVQGVNYSNLVEQIEDFPEQSHWYAISNALREMGILTQLSHNAFYITWHLPQPSSSAFDAV